MSPLYSRPFSGHYFALASGASTITSRSLWDEELHFTPLNPGQRLTFRTWGPAHQPLLVVVAGFEKSQHPITIAVAQDLTYNLERTQRFQVNYALITVVALIALIAIQRWHVRRALRPLDQARQQVIELYRGNTHRLSEHVPVEIAPLVIEINGLVATLEQRLLRSRNAVGNLAHGLKTPLAILRQLSHRPELDPFPDLRKLMEDQIQVLAERTEQELKRARLAGKPKAGYLFRIYEEVTDLISVLNTMYAGKKLRFSLDVPRDMTIPMDREDAMEILGNIIDNACKWASHQISVHAEMDDQIRFIIADDGPGCTDTALKDLATRGKRADENTAGHGLGLAIVHDVVMDYQGELSFARSKSLGGFEVTISLPSRPDLSKLDG
jgi:signal transduction histidine kinase